MPQILILDRNETRRDKLSVLLHHMGYDVDVPDGDPSNSGGWYLKSDLLLIDQAILGQPTQSDRADWLAMSTAPVPVSATGELDDAANVAAAP